MLWNLRALFRNNFYFCCLEIAVNVEMSCHLIFHIFELELARRSWMSNFLINCGSSAWYEESVLLALRLRHLSFKLLLGTPFIETEKYNKLCHQGSNTTITTTVLILPKG